MYVVNQQMHTAKTWVFLYRQNDFACWAQVNLICSNLCIRGISKFVKLLLQDQMLIIGGETVVTHNGNYRHIR
jgi:hypothetical protein